MTDVDLQKKNSDFFSSYVFKARANECIYRINKFSQSDLMFVSVRESNLEFDQSIFAFDRVTRSEHNVDIQFLQHCVSLAIELQLLAAESISISVTLPSN